MNSTSQSLSSSGGLVYRDSAGVAVAKNVIVLALGLSINYINGTLVHTFRKHQALYVNPRYILFVHLVLNDMIQLTSSIIMFVLSYVVYTINASLCCFFYSFSLFTTLNTPLNLAMMAVECCIAVCFPLRHAQLCTVRRTYLVIGWVWALNAALVLLDVAVVLATEPERLFHARIFCNAYELFRHPISLLKRDVSYLLYLSTVWLTLLYAYFRIFFAARAANSNNPLARKARNTVLLHGFQLLLCMLTYVHHWIESAFRRWFPQHFVQILFGSFIVVFVLPRFLSPIVYGLRDKTFKQYFKKHLLCTVRRVDTF